MQKLVTVSINLEELRRTAQGTFTITNVEEINSLLEEGWMIDEYEFLSGGPDDDHAVVLFILNDTTETEFDLTADYAGDEEDEDSLLEDDDEKEGTNVETEEDGDESNRTHANVPMI